MSFLFEFSQIAFREIGAYLLFGAQDPAIYLVATYHIQIEIFVRRERVDADLLCCMCFIQKIVEAEVRARSPRLLRIESTIECAGKEALPDLPSFRYDEIVYIVVLFIVRIREGTTDREHADEGISL